MVAPLIALGSGGCLSPVGPQGNSAPVDQQPPVSTEKHYAFHTLSPRGFQGDTVLLATSALGPDASGVTQTWQGVALAFLSTGLPVKIENIFAVTPPGKNQEPVGFLKDPTTGNIIIAVNEHGQSGFITKVITIDVADGQGRIISERTIPVEFGHTSHFSTYIGTHSTSEYFVSHRSHDSMARVWQSGITRLRFGSSEIVSTLWGEGEIQYVSIGDSAGSLSWTNVDRWGLAGDPNRLRLIRDSATGRTEGPIFALQPNSPVSGAFVYEADRSSGTALRLLLAGSRVNCDLSTLACAPQNYVETCPQFIAVSTGVQLAGVCYRDSERQTIGLVGSSTWTERELPSIGNVSPLALASSNDWRTNQVRIARFGRESVAATLRVDRLDASDDSLAGSEVKLPFSMAPGENNTVPNER